MKINVLVNLLLIISVLLVLLGVYQQIMTDETISLWFWIGLLVYAVAEIIKNKHKKQ